MGSINRRALVIGIVVILIAISFASKLFMIQVYDQSYKFSAENNARRNVIQYPSRGLIYDRNGKLLVSNQAVYDVMIVPRDVVSFDSTDFCLSLGISHDELRAMFVEMRKNIRSREISTYKPSVFFKQMSVAQYGRFQEKLHKFKGFFVQRRTIRKYEYPIAAHIFGYIGEVDKKQLDPEYKHFDPYYSKGDYIGISGIESTYEKVLRGEKGAKYILVDVHGREKGNYNHGEYNIPAVAGKNIKLSIDITIQEYGERLMQNKIGSIVAIEPSTGEILAFVSAPYYDPNSLVGRGRGEEFKALAQNKYKPLNNRGLQGTYSPGSSFKLVNGVIGLQTKAITPQTRFSCNGPSTAPIKCTHHHRSPIELLGAVETSCNPFFYNTFREIIEKGVNTREGYQTWYNHVKSMGFGDQLGIDLPYEKGGNVPKKEYYDKYYGMKGWRALTIRSLAIGQGELTVTPLQMANEVSIFANRGFYFTPHVVKAIDGQPIDERYTQKHYTTMSADNFEEVIKGMARVFDGDIGTARLFKNDSISMCGKTGTVQNPFGEDHSVFIAFAPRINPKIAIGVIVENAGYGSTWAAPIATLLIEKYLTGEVPARRKAYEEKLLNANFTPKETEQPKKELIH